MVEDILPPAPPGEQKPAAKEKKKGFLAGLFGKKAKEEPKEEPLPAPTPAPKPSRIHELPDISLDDIRTQLGLNDLSKGKDEIPEPPGITKDSKKPSVKKQGVDLPDIEAAIASAKIDQPITVILEEEPVDEPPKILLMESTGKTKKPSKKQAEKTKAKSSAAKWTKDVEEAETPKQESEFTKNVETKEDSDEAPAKKEFLEEVSPDEIKQSVKKSMRKKFEEKKGIQYEPTVTPETTRRKPAEKGQYLIDASPQDEIANIKKRILQKTVTEETPAPISMPQPPAKEEKRAQVIETERELPDLGDEKRIGGKLSILENEDMEEQEEEPPEEPEKIRPSFVETKPKIEELPIDNSEIIKEMEKNLIEKIRTEEKERVEKEYEEEKSALEKQKQGLEQERIAVAGKASRYDFKEKQLKREKTDVDADKAKLKREKEEASELIKKLPGMRKDYEKLSERMAEIYENLKAYSKKEAELREIEKNIEQNKEALAQAQQRLADTEKKIKEKGFSQYLETELKEESMVSPKLEEEQDITHASNLEIYNLIDECKAMIRDRNIAGAKRVYMKVREAYNNINLKGTEKDLLYTAVRELYDDIKLAEMEIGGL